jgi:hypothetical protein
MAIITSYATLQTAIGDYLNRADLASFLPNFTQGAEGKLYKSLRIRAMETALSGTIGSGVLAVPADYVELKYAYVNVAPVRFLQRVPAELMYEQYPVRSGAAYPKFIAREADNFIFGPYPADLAIAGIYYKRLTALSASNTTNWFITNAPNLLLYGSVLEAEPFLGNDPRLPMWKAMFDYEFKAVQDEDRRESSSGSAPRTRAM